MVSSKKYWFELILSVFNVSEINRVYKGHKPEAVIVFSLAMVSPRLLRGSNIWQIIRINFISLLVGSIQNDFDVISITLRIA